MDMEFKEATTPTLTLDPFKEAEKSRLVQLPEPMDDTARSAEEREMVDAFAPVSYTHLDVYKRQY